MAYIRELGKDRWRAQVERAGVRRSAVRETRRAAEDWAAREEAALLDAKRGVYPANTLRDAMEKYAREVSPTKRRERNESNRLTAFCRDFPQIADKVISDIRTPDLARWRDARLAKVTPASVERDLRLISHVFTIARNEWKWCGDSPLKGLGRPGDNPPRDRRVFPSEVRRICRWLGYRTGAVRTKQQQVALAFLIALRTGMRASEVLSLSAGNVDLDRRVATVQHKTQRLTGRPREVPLSKPAIRLLRQLDPAGFTLTSASLDALFRKATRALLIQDLHFHDSRGEALTRLSRKVDVMSLARVSGHKDLRTLMDHYYRETAADIARRLD